jgi:hypothetical protein
MSENEGAPAPVSELTDNLYTDFINLWKREPRPYSVKEIQRELRPKASWQKVYYSIQGMVAAGALQKGPKGIEPIFRNDYSWLPKFINVDELEQWYRTNVTAEREEEWRNKMITDFYVKKTIFETIVRWTLRRKAGHNDD